MTKFYTFKTAVFSCVLTTGLVLSTLLAQAQAPANDACASATALTPGAAAVSGTNTNATATSEPAKPTCWTNANDPNNTVWYSFTTTTAGNYTVTAVPTATVRLLLEGLSGTCAGTLTNIGCADAGSNTATATMTLTGLAAATTYYVRVDGMNAQNGTFTIAVSNPAVTSTCTTFDECACATNLVVQAGFVGTYNNTGTTTSSQDGAPSCWDAVADNTVWFKFTTGSLGGTYTITTDDGSGNDTQLELFSGSCGGVLTELGCSEDKVPALIPLDPTANYAAEIVANGLAANTTYYVMADIYGTTAGDFVIKVDSTVTSSSGGGGGGGCAATVANDCCVDAIELIVDDPCTTGTTSMSATLANESNVPSPSCWNEGANHTIWYKFKSGDAGTYIISTADPTGNPLAPIGAVPQLQVLSGSCTGAMTEVGCRLGSEDGAPGSPAFYFQDVTADLAANTDYFIRVDGFGNSDTTAFDFCISVQFLPVSVPPIGTPSPGLVPNDECTGAIDITVNQPCSGDPYDDTGATASGGANDPNASCFGIALAGITPPYSTVWFSFTTIGTDSANYTVSAVSGTADLQLAVWDGACGSFTELGCNDGGAIGDEETVVLRKLPPGRKYYYSISEYGTGAQGPFCTEVNAEIANTDPSDTIPVVNDCVANAIDLTNQISGGLVVDATNGNKSFGALNKTTNPFNCGVYRYTNTGQNSTARSTVSGDRTSNCDDTVNTAIQDIWFKFTIPSTGVKAWIDAYEIAKGLGAKGEYRAALYSGSPTTADCNTGAISGLTYIDCSAGVTASTGKRGGAKDMSTCSAGFPRLDLNGLTPGATYYYRIWYKTAPQTEPQEVQDPLGIVTFTFSAGGAGSYVYNGILDVSVCIETSEPDGTSADNCAAITTPTLAGTVCGTLPNFNYSSSFANLNNAGKYGKRTMTPACNTNEPNFIATTAKGEASNGCTGTFAAATIAAGDADSTFHTNTSVYRFDVAACTGNQGLATLKFDNLKFGGLDNKGLRVQVISANCTSTAAADVVMYGTSAGGGTCYQIRNTLPSGSYYVVVEGEGGQLAKYDLSLDLKYDINSQNASHKPVASFAPKTVKTQYCADENIVLKFNGDAGFGVGTVGCTNPVYTWTVSAGATVVAGGTTTSDTVVVRRASAGSINVKLTVTNSGCSSVEFEQTYVIFQPSSDFTLPTPAVACQNSPINISYAGGSPSTATYSWNFGVGSSPTPAATNQQGPYNVLWSSTGAKALSLTVIEGGCSSTTNKPLTVNARPNAQFTVTSLSVCQNGLDTLTWTPNGGGDGFTWDFDGATIVSATTATVAGPHYVKWPTTGLKQVSLVVTNTTTGCSSAPAQVSINVTPIPDPDITFSQSAACAGEQITVSTTAIPGADYTWNFGTGATPAVPSNTNSQLVSWAAGAAVRTVTLSVASGNCASSVVSKDILINAAPAAPSITAPATACFGAPIPVSASPTTFQSYDWNLNGGNQSGTGANIQSTWNTAGVKNISLTVTDAATGCTATSLPQSITVGPKITIGITAVQPNPCGNSNGQLTANAAPAGTYTYQWTDYPAGASTPATLKAGSYIITATETASGCTADSLYALTDGGAGTISELKRVNVSCYGAATGSDSIRMVGGVGPFDPQLFDGSGNLVATITELPNGDFLAEDLPAGDYYWQIADNTGCQAVFNFTISQPAEFIVDLGADYDVCGNDVTLSPSVVGGVGAYDYLWNTTETTSSITAAGDYTDTYTVTVTDDNACSVSDQITLTYNNPLNADFTISDQSICADGMTDISFSGSNPIGKVYNWDFGNNANPASDAGVDRKGPFSVSYTAPGTKTVVLEVTDPQCINTSNQTINVVGAPDATFTAASEVCAGAKLPVKFIGVASSTANFNWSYDGGTPSGNPEDQTREVVWTVPGVKTITLTLTDGDCAPDVFTQTVTVNPSPEFTFVTPANGVCVNESTAISVEGTFTNPVYQWNFDDDGDNTDASAAIPPASTNSGATVLWNQAGSYTISLSVTDAGCTKVDNTTIIVHDVPNSSFTSSASICLSDTAIIKYVGGEQNASFNWVFTSGTPATSTQLQPKGPKWTSAGDYDLSLQVTSQFGCKSVISKNEITVFPLPTNAFTLPGNICEGNQATIQATYTNDAEALYEWVFDGTASQFSDPYSRTQSVAWSIPARKDVKLTVTDSNGCKSLMNTQQIVVNSTPVADFTVSSQRCKNADVTVTFTGTASAGASFFWNFGPNATVVSGSGAGPYVIRWSAAGTEIVSLDSILDGGCKTASGMSRTITISDAPTSGFSIDKTAICFGDQVAVDYTGDPAGAAQGATYAWDFGKDSVLLSKQMNAEKYQITWSTGGTKTIKLTVTNQAGCSSSTTTQTVSVAPELKISFAYEDAFPCGSATGSATALPTPAGTYTYKWNTTPIQTTKKASNLAAGFYQVVVTTTTGKVCSDSAIATVSDQAAPSASIIRYADVSCGGASDGYAIALAQGGAGNYTYLWNDAAATASDSVGALSEGTYVCRVTDQAGCRRFISIDIKEPNKLFAFAGSDQVICSGEIATLTGGATGGTTEYKYQWSSGGNTQSVEVTPFARTGYKLQVTDAKGCIATDSVYVDVTTSPVASFDVSAPSNLACAGEEVAITFDGTADPGTDFDWFFDGATEVSGSGAGPYVLKWFSGGSKTITLNLETNGCSSSESAQTITVNSPRTATFNAPATVCTGATATITYTGNASSSATYRWDFGVDYNIISGSGPGPYVVSWNSPGTRTVSLTTEEDNCSAVFSRNVVVNDAPTSSFTVSGASCQNSPVLVDYTGTAGSGATFAWDFDGGIGIQDDFDAIDLPDTLVSWNTPGVKTITLTVLQNGCSSVTTTQQTVVKPAPSAAFTISTAGGGSGIPTVCPKEKATINYDDVPSSTASYEWNFGTGSQVLSGTESGPYDVHWLSSGFKVVSLTVTDGGCSATNTSQVFVSPKPEASVAVTSPACGASNGRFVITFSKGTPEYFSEIYSFNTGAYQALTSSGSVTTYNALEADGYFLTFVDATFQCRTDTLIALSNAPIAYSASHTTTDETEADLNNGSVTITLSATGPAYTIDVYSQETGYVDGTFGVSGPYTVNNLAPGNYFYRATDGTSCSINKTFTIKEAIPLLLSAGSDKEVCSGGDVIITAKVTGGQLPYQFTFDSNPPQASNTYTLAGVTANQTVHVQVQDAAGVIKETDVNIIVKPLPVASFMINGTAATTDDFICFGKTGTVEYNGGPVSGLAFNWDFDNATVESKTANEKYVLKWATPGTKTIKLTVIDQASGCENSALSQTILVDAIPTATFVPSSDKVCSGDVLTFSYTGTGTASSLYNWTFPNGTPASSSNQDPGTVTWTNATSGTVKYSVSLVVSTIQGCSSPVGKQDVTVKPLPSPNFSMPSQLCISNSAKIDASPAATDVSYVYDFNGGIVVSGGKTVPGPNQVKWNTPGTYNVKLVTNLNGCESQLIQPIVVNARPVVDFTLPANPCPNDTITVQTTTVLDPSTIYNWNGFNGAKILTGDPNAQGPGPFGIRWPNSGLNAVDLTVLVGDCPSLPVRRTTTVKPKTPVPEVKPITVCRNATGVQPLTAKAASNGTLVWYGQNPSGPGSSTAPIPNTSTAGRFNYFVSQIVNGCESDRVRLVVTIQELDNASFRYENNVTSICSNAENPFLVAIPFLPNGKYSASSTLINLDKNNGVIDASKSFAGVYTIKYTTPATTGACPNTDSLRITILSPPDASFTYDGDPNGYTDNVYEYCQNGTDPNATLGATTPTGGKFKVLETGMSINEVTGKINLKASALGKYTVYYEITDPANGCAARPIPMNVHIKRTPDADFVSKSSACLGDMVSFNFKDPSKPLGNAAKYTWTFADTTFFGRGPHKRKWDATGPKDMTLVVDLLGCVSDTVKRTIDIEPVPEPNFVTDRDTLPYIVNFNQVEPIQFFPLNSSYDRYSWNFDDFSSSDEMYPIHLYTKPGRYAITLTTSIKECTRVSDTLAVVIITDLKEAFVPNAFSPNGDGRNDILIFNTLGLKSAKIEIFNRWGQLVYTGTESNTGWDGAFKDEIVPEGVYVYNIIGRTYTNKVYNKSGYVTVVK